MKQKNKTKKSRKFSAFTLTLFKLFFVIILDIGFMFIFKGHKELSFFLSFIILLITTIFFEKIVFKHNHKALKLLKKKEYEEAIEEYIISYEFILKRKFICKLGELFLIPEGDYTSYKEITLLNIAFCYLQLKNIDKLKNYYQKILEEFPGNEEAKAMLDIINSDNADEYIQHILYLNNMSREEKKLLKICFFYFNIKAYKKAKKQCEKLLEIFPDNKEAVKIIEIIDSK